MPLVLATRAKQGPNLLSLSRIRYSGACPYGVASRSGTGHPGIGRRSRDPDMDHPSRLQEGEEEGEERSKQEISDLQEVAGPDVGSVVAEKRAPLLTSWRLCANSSHVLLDGALADL